jgi:hypothetical protein
LQIAFAKPVLHLSAQQLKHISAVSHCPHVLQELQGGGGWVCASKGGLTEPRKRMATENGSAKLDAPNVFFMFFFISAVSGAESKGPAAYSLQFASRMRLLAVDFALADNSREDKPRSNKCPEAKPSLKSRAGCS